MAKANKAAPPAWPAWPEYPGHAVMRAIDWAEFESMHGGYESKVRPTAATARVMADWLEEHGLPQLAALWRHWADCWPRVRAADLDEYERVQWCVGMEVAGMFEQAWPGGGESVWHEAGVKWKMHAYRVGARLRTGGDRPAAGGDDQPSSLVGRPYAGGWQKLPASQ